MRKVLLRRREQGALLRRVRKRQIGDDGGDARKGGQRADQEEGAATRPPGRGSQRGRGGQRQRMGIPVISQEEIVIFRVLNRELQACQTSCKVAGSRPDRLERVEGAVEWQRKGSRPRKRLAPRVRSALCAVSLRSA
jgi:hypothetical protein